MRVQLGGRGPGPAEQRSLRRVQGRALGVPRGPRPGLRRSRRARGLRPARFRPNRDDRRAAGAAVRGRSGDGGRGGAPGHRHRPARRVCPRIWRWVMLAIRACRAPSCAACHSDGDAPIGVRRSMETQFRRAGLPAALASTRRRAVLSWRGGGEDQTREDGPHHQRPATAQTVELLQQLIRNQCVNDGTVASGQEVRPADCCAPTSTGRASTSRCSSRRGAGPHESRRPHRRNRSGRPDALPHGPHRRRARDPRGLDARSLRGRAGRTGRCGGEARSTC